MARLKLRQLESRLEEVEAFDRPKILLEQYPTRAQVASAVLFSVQTSFGDLENKLVADLGCGCGVLSIGACLLGAGAVVGFDVDPDALEVCRENLAAFELDHCDLVLADVVPKRNVDAGTPGIPNRFARRFDTVIANPPFGTKHNRGIDLAFVKAGLDLLNGASGGAVYSLHKTSTRAHVGKKAAAEWNVKADVLAQLRYDLPASYRHHRKASVDVDVDLWRFAPVVKGGVRQDATK